MTENDLLEQEEAYHKLNAELELKTRKLMKDVEAVMNKESYPKLWSKETIYSGVDDFYNTQCPRARSAFLMNGSKSPLSDISSEQTDYNIHKSHPKLANGFSRLNNTPKRREFYGSRNSLNKITFEHDDIMPASTRGMSSESLVRFLKAKAKLLHEELSNAKREYALKVDDWRKLQVDMRSLEEDKMKLTVDLVAARDKIKRNEEKIATLNERLSLRDSENSLLKKQLDTIKHDMKKINLTSAGSEAKLNKAKEEIEKLKSLLKKSQTNEKEARDKCRAKDEEMVQTVRKLEKQKAELVSGVRKQIYLMDNLRKQKSYLELDASSKHMENEFVKLLEWKPEGVK